MHSHGASLSHFAARAQLRYPSLSMRIVIRRVASTLLLALVPAFFCALMTAPLSFALPLSCPEGSQVIGIECFDSRYNNTTPWYRRDLNPSFASFPLWLAGALVAAWFWSAPRPPSSAPVSAAEPDPLILVTAPPPTATAQTATKAETDADKRWLPIHCPHCGGVLAIIAVLWISS